jgi:hypothetical protein
MKGGGAMASIVDMSEMHGYEFLKKFLGKKKGEKNCDSCKVAQPGLTNYGLLPVVCLKCIKGGGERGTR